MTTVGDHGGFVARWRTDHIGRFRIRARVDTGVDGNAQAASATPELDVTVYKPAVATWYGPGFYGRKTACGLKMSRTLLGVAHRTLPCGTQVALFFGGRTVVVPVVDRGPFAHGAQWDLTSATAESLGFTVTGKLGAVRLREPVPQPAG
jgi:rare lipoprotein A (peptidoglycan hydrolase)